MKLLLVFLLVVSCALAYPRPPVNRRISQQRAAARLRRAPVAAASRHRTMLISHGYYRPLYAHRRQGYEPETAMTAFATGDNVAAGSYLGTTGSGCAACVEQDNTEYVGAPEPNEEPLDQNQDFPQPEAPLVVVPLAEAPLEELPLSDPSADTELAPPQPKPFRKPKAPVKKPQPEPEDDEDEYITPSKGSKGSNTYFPIVFGAGGARSGAPGGSGGVTAIANSYSSGKGGVANSHATAYGAGSGPSSRRRSKRPQQEAEDSDDEE